MSTQFLPKSASLEWLKSLAGEFALFAPAVVKEQVHWQKLDPATVTGDSEPMALERIRASEPVKSFFFTPREKVAAMPGSVEPVSHGKRILFGAKGCDVVALRVHRKMYLEQEHKDEFYRTRRASTLIVAADCPMPTETCFCNLVGNRPFATSDDKDEVDIALSVVEGGWLLEALSPAGEKLVGLARTSPATEAQLAARKASRVGSEQQLAKANPKGFVGDLPARIWKRNTDDAFWASQSKDCVECYGCLMACPTCYCFLLYDKAKGKGMERAKVWDACYIAAYARVGGGANPRAEFVKRFYNRYFCKFSHFKTWQGMYACTGCGRCSAACMGKIDVRRALLEV